MCIKLGNLTVRLSVHHSVAMNHLKNKVAARDDFVEEEDDATQHDKDHNNSMGLHCIDNGGRLLD